MASKSKGICTTKEQSKRLVELGVSAETADMSYHHRNAKSPFLEWELQLHHTTRKNFAGRIERLNSNKLYKRKDGTSMTGDEVFNEIWGQDIPAWSLTALLRILPHTIYDSNNKDYTLIIGPHDGIWKARYGHDGRCRMCVITGDTPIDVCVAMAEWLIKQGYSLNTAEE